MTKMIVNMNGDKGENLCNERERIYAMANDLLTALAADLTIHGRNYPIDNANDAVNEEKAVRNEHMKNLQKLQEWMFEEIMTLRKQMP